MQRPRFMYQSTRARLGNLELANLSKPIITMAALPKALAGITDAETCGAYGPRFFHIRLQIVEMLRCNQRIQCPERYA